MLIFDKDEHFNYLLENGFEKYPNKRDLTILCTKWKEQGFQNDDILQKMNEVCLKHCSQFNYAKAENLFLNVIKNVENPENYQKNFEFCSKIVFFAEEIEKIKEIPEKKLQKVIFVMMSIAKWRNSDFVYLNSGGTLKLKDVFELAGITATSKQQALMIHSLAEAGFIEVQLKPLLKCHISIIKNTGESVLEFKIGKNLIEEWTGIGLPRCERCGRPYERTAYSQKYCHECAKIVKQEKTNASKRNSRRIQKWKKELDK